jgi:Mce-associated membrane protein
VTTEDHHDVTDVDTTAEEIDESLAGEPEPTATVEPTAGTLVDRTPELHEVPTFGAGGPRRLLVPIMLAVFFLSSAGLTSWAYLTQFRPDQQTDAAAAAATIKAASEGSIALLSYSPDRLDKDFAAAKTHLTGKFLDYYTKFSHDIVTAAQQKAVKTSASVVRSAVSDLNPDSAVVLLFLNQTTTSKENPDGSSAARSVKVGLTRVNGAWLISAFDPV